MINLKNNKYLKRISVLGIITILILSTAGCSNTNSEVVAKVNDEVITKDDLYNILVAQGGEQLLESLINEIIINSEAEKAGIKVTDKEIQAELEKMTETYGGEDAFTEAMEYYGYDMKEIEKNIDMNFKIKKLLEPRIEITDDEIEEYFENNKKDFKEEEQVKASHILVEEEDEAVEIYNKLQEGESFEDLAAEHSIDGSAESGGDLGYFGRGKMVKEFEEAAFGLDIDEISEPVKSEHGYHIIKLIDKKEEKDAKLKDHKDLIKDKILEDEIPSVYNEWYEEIIGDYKIENKLTD